MIGRGPANYQKLGNRRERGQPWCANRAEGVLLRAMNPLLFADWGRMNRLFTRVMWIVVVIMLFVVCVALAAPAPRSRAASAAPAVHAPVAAPSAHPTAASGGSIR